MVVATTYYLRCFSDDDRASWLVQFHVLPRTRQDLEAKAETQDLIVDARGFTIPRFGGLMRRKNVALVATAITIATGAAAAMVTAAAPAPNTPHAAPPAPETFGTLKVPPSTPPSSKLRRAIKSVAADRSDLNLQPEQARVVASTGGRQVAILPGPDTICLIALGEYAACAPLWSASNPETALAGSGRARGGGYRAEVLLPDSVSEVVVESTAGRRTVAVENNLVTIFSDTPGDSVSWAAPNGAVARLPIGGHPDPGPS